MFISVYSPQLGLSKNKKGDSWEHMGELLQRIPKEENLFIEGDLNGYVGKDNSCYECMEIVDMG